MTEEHRPRVLVVDDHPKLLRFVEIDLKLRGFLVILASSGKQALELVGADRPDIMLLDIIMPGMDGFEVLRKLRKFSLLPVIAFSAILGNRDMALQLGANDFVSKPFEPVELARRICALLPAEV